MPGPFEDFEPMPLTTSDAPVALVADTDADVDAYLALGQPASYVVVRSAADVPERLGGMAILTQRDLGDELRDALVTALAATPA
jgi:hypothetical protein